MRLRNPFRNIKYGISNLWAYKGLIWRDRDWDFEFLYLLLEMKLKRMADYHREHGMATSSGLAIIELEEAAEHLRKVREEETSYSCTDGAYTNEGYERHEAELREHLVKFGKLFELSRGWWD